MSGRLPFTRIQTVQPRQPVSHSLVNKIQDDITTLDQPISYTPTVAGVHPDDYVAQRGVYVRTKWFVEVWVTLSWTNVANSPAQDDTDVQISIPWTPATLSGGMPTLTERMADNVGSIWPTSATDDGLQLYVIHAAPDNVLRVRRVDGNATVGSLKVGNVLTSLVGHIRYFADPNGQMLI